MGSIEVYRIATDGEVTYYDRAKNAHACLPHIWAVLAKKYAVPDPFARAREAGESKLRENEPLWALYGSGKLAEQDDAILGFTFDASWCAKEHIGRLCAALASFWEHHSTMVDWNGRTVSVDDTVPRLIVILRRLEVDDDCRGVCFNQTSVNTNPWVVVLDPDPAAHETRSFVFGQDLVDLNGAEPVELFKVRS